MSGSVTHILRGEGDWLLCGKDLDDIGKARIIVQQHPEEGDDWQGSLHDGMAPICPECYRVERQTRIRENVKNVKETP